MKRVSIKKQLLVLFIPFLFGLWISSGVLSFWLVSAFSREAFDRDLVNSADSVVGRLRVRDGRIALDLPPAAQAILKHDEADKFYYRVLRSDGNIISGDNGLPDPSTNLPIDLPVIMSAKVGQRAVRLAEIRVALHEAQGQTVTVQVAETTNARNRFQEKMLLSIMAPQLLVVLLGFFAAWYGIARILTPLGILTKQVTTRSHSDLRALPAEQTPEEVYPLVHAINRLLVRLSDDIKAHQRFIANAAHQLRTPLAGLKTYSSVGLEMSDPKDLKHVVRELDQGIDRATRMVTQLLALARADGGDPAVLNGKTQTDLNFVVSDAMAELVEKSIQKNVELVFDAAQSPVTVYGDRTGLRHMLINLLENAIIYSKPGGTVTARVRDEGTPLLTITDGGRGIPTDERENVFERFYRVVGTNGNGSGLGLSIVKEVANAHDAQVTIDSGTGGIGTCVTVEFPDARKAIAKSADESIL